SLPSVHGQRPHLMLTASVDALAGSPQAMPAELALAGPVHAETARRIACDASVSALTVAGSEPLSVGREKRSIPAALRRALAHRDRGCRFPGCDRPPEWTDGHHVTHWAHGGETSVANLVLLCRVHHRRVHDEGWSLRLVPSGEVLVEPP
ncbi:MAG TPA: HNH endonuclease, partial [Candidatus Acidoferrales bacterium]|nr:HNH endonuclease [Candidatus Acidoferrales bacterium]